MGVISSIDQSIGGIPFSPHGHSCLAGLVYEQFCFAVLEIKCAAFDADKPAATHDLNS